MIELQPILTRMLKKMDAFHEWDISIRYNKRLRTSDGLMHYDREQMVADISIMPGQTREEIRDTVGHELAHLAKDVLSDEKYAETMARVLRKA